MSLRTPRGSISLSLCMLAGAIMGSPAYAQDDEGEEALPDLSEPMRLTPPGDLKSNIPAATGPDVLYTPDLGSPSPDADEEAPSEMTETLPSEEPTGEGTDGAALKVLVIPLRAQGVDENTANIVYEAVATDLSKRPGFNVVTITDINTLLSVERTKDLLGCDDVSCFTDIGGALNADRILTGSVSKLGNVWVVTLEWLDVLYNRPLARASRKSREIDYLLDDAKTVLRDLLGESASDDARDRRLKRRPSFWTLEAAGVIGSRQGAEDYRPRGGGNLRLAFGGKQSGGRVYYYAGLSLGGTIYRGKDQSVGFAQVSYDRAQIDLTLDLRAALPIAKNNRLRLYAMVGGGMQWEIYSAKQRNGISISGATVNPVVRVGAGLWYRLRPQWSLYGGYRLRIQIATRGTDPISELVRIGSTESIIPYHEGEAGLAWHF